MKIKRRPIVIGNWKMNPQTLDSAVRLGTAIKKRLSRVSEVEVVLAPPFVFIPALFRVQNGSHSFALGAQNVHPEKLGAHTGEISLPMLKEFNISHVIIGHSERRAQGESDVDVHAKLVAALKAGFTPIVCIGESERDHAAQYLNTIEHQIRTACAGLSRTQLESMIIAYEPVWAIGTGNNATPEDVHEMKLFIQKVLADTYGRNNAEKVRIIYGGSVSSKNARSIVEGGIIDGFLVGGASLSEEEFSTIIASFSL